MNPVFLMKRNPLLLLQIRMQLHLMYRRWVRSMVQQILELFRVEVTDADMTGLAFFEEQAHGGPGIAVLDAITAQGGLGDRPVHVVEIEVADAKFLEGGVDTSLGSVSAVAAQCQPWVEGTMVESGHTDRSIAC